MNLADNLKRIRKENNLSQEQLAEKLGVSRQAVSKWESGQSYPEMDKVLQICSLFNLNINELINENIKEVNETKESKNISNKYVTSFFDYLTKVVDMFSSMKFMQIMGCLFEQFVICMILLLIFAIIGGIASGLASPILMAIFPISIYYPIIRILEAIYIIVSFVIGAAILFHVFKIRYLDYYEFVKVDQKPRNKVVDSTIENGTSEEKEEAEELVDEDTGEENAKKQKIILEKRHEKVIIRDPKHSDFKFISGLGKAILWTIKFFVAWLLFFFAIGFIWLVACLVLSFLFVKTGVLFIGFILAMIGCLIICAICIELMFNFIFSRKNSKTRLFITGIISLIAIGVGSGMLLIGISEFDIAKQDVDTVKDEFVFEMKDNLMIARHYNYYHNVEYVIEDRKDVKIEVEHSKYYISEIDEEGGFIYIYNHVPDGEAMNMVRMFIKDFNNKKIVNYDSEQSVKVYASKENIEIMKQNRKEYFDEMDSLVDELETSRNEVNRLLREADRLESLLDTCGYTVVRDTNDRIVEIHKNIDDEDVMSR